jgi:dTDP-glucose pyrophosphorylase
VSAGLVKAVILARGLGTRMRRAVEGAVVDELQAQVADTGIKAMIPIVRPFLDYVITGLADAGFRDVCLVIGPEHDAIRDYYHRRVSASRIQISFAVQALALGTANAVAAASGFTGRDQFLVINSDNYYPAAALQAVRELAGCGLAGFDRAALVRDGNVDDARVSRYAVLRVSADGWLEGIVEKPEGAEWERTAPDALISMNCWRFGPAIFRAIDSIGLSPRGEYELADAVQAAIAAGERFKVVRVEAGVLDLSHRADIASVARRLEGVEGRL